MMSAQQQQQQQIMTTTTKDTTRTTTAAMPGGGSGSEKGNNASSNTTTTQQLVERSGDDSNSSISNNQIIHILPKEVVDRIAAGEVVQRASSAIKEIMENSLDAGSTIVKVCVDADNLQKISIFDNGCGINKSDLPMVCLRHATSKLKSHSDLCAISSFGFRGEALASISMVSRVHIISKTHGSGAAAYQLQYIDGQPLSSGVPTPTARSTIGTTVTIHDLFYNVPHRHASISTSRAANNEYQMILKVLNAYSVHYSGVSFQCIKQKTKKNKNSQQVDLNTNPSGRTSTNNNNRQQLDDEDKTMAMATETTTKQTIAQVYGSHLLSNLVLHKSELLSSLQQSVEISSNNDKGERGVDGSTNNNTIDHPEKTTSNTSGTTATMAVDEEKKQDEILITGNSTTEEGSTSHDNGQLHTNSNERREKIIYSCTGFVATPNSTKKIGGNSNKRTFILFINNRLVDGCTPIRRVVENVCMELFQGEKPEFMYLSIAVPPETVDVNVHPTKREVTLLHLDTIGQHLSQSMKLTLAPYVEQQQTFAANNVLMNKKNPYASANNKRKRSVLSETTTQTPSNNTATNTATTKKAAVNSNKQPKTMVRTSRNIQTGAMEKFVVFSQRQELPTSSSSSSGQSPRRVVSHTQADPAQQQEGGNDDDDDGHEPDCPLRNPRSNSNDVDLAAPGAFAAAARQCQCPNKKTPSSAATAAAVVRLPRYTAAATTLSGRLRLQKLPPTDCTYTSIKQLRKRIHKRRDETIEKQLRSACFVGTVSQDRSLIQCQQELVMWNHFEYARELFYQLALFRFGGGCGVATLGSPIDIQAVIGQFMEIEETYESRRSTNDTNEGEDDEDQIPSLPIQVSDTNQSLSQQAATFLLEHADMLLQYFSIQIEKDDDTIQLVGLPVLLEGYEPSPHGLPLFLLRLATETNWEEEKPCFHSVCYELGCYYAQLPYTNDAVEHASVVRHSIFPAVSALLIPTDRPQKSFETLTSLPKLYRVFERC